MSKTQAKKLGLKFIQRKNLLSKGDHAKGHIVRGAGGRKGLPHIQDRTIENSHMFYESLGDLIAAGAATSKVNPRCDVDLEIIEIFSEDHQGPSLFEKLSVGNWVDEDSPWRHLDWVNPLELIANAGELGRSIDQRLSRETAGYVITIFNREEVLWTLHFDPELTLRSAVGGDGNEHQIGAELLTSILDHLK